MRFALHPELVERFRTAVYDKGLSANQVMENFMERVIEACETPGSTALKDLLGITAHEKLNQRRPTVNGRDLFPPTPPEERDAG
jgi:hypothetical protein